MVLAGSRLWAARGSDPAGWLHHGHLGVTLLGPRRLRRAGVHRRELARLRDELLRLAPRRLEPRQLTAPPPPDDTAHRPYLPILPSISHPAPSTPAPALHPPTRR